MRGRSIIVATAIVVGALCAGAGVAVSEDGKEQVADSVAAIKGKPAKQRAVRVPRGAAVKAIARGPRGYRGARGYRGPRGYGGATGAQGIQGPAGPVNLGYGVGTARGISGYDAVELGCPSGRAVTGGFVSDSALVLLNGSSPGSSPSSWVIEVTYIGETSAVWVPTVSCV